MVHGKPPVEAPDFQSEEPGFQSGGKTMKQ